MSEAGERAGEESEEYKTSRERCSSISKGIGGDKIEALRDFCKKYSESELKYRRENLLNSLGYTEEEYANARRGGECTKAAKRVFGRAARLRAVSLTPKMLLSMQNSRSKSELENPEKSKLVSMILRLIPTTVCMTVTVSVVLTAKDNMNVTTVIDGLFKLASLPIIGLRGYASGYFYSRYTLPLWIDTKARLLDAFLKEHETKTA
jgi:hypothetical protein